MGKTHLLSIIFGAEKWTVPLTVIAEHRARYHAGFDNPGKLPCTWDYKQTYKAELDIGLRNHPILIEWASGNMDWIEIESFATMEPINVIVDRVAEWANAIKTIVEG